MRTNAGTPGHRRGGSMIFRFLAAAGSLLAVLALLTPGQARAQLATADVLGTVTDNTGAVIPNAKVTLLNTGTGIAATSQTNTVGEYIFSRQQIGAFKVTVEANGFKSFTVTDLTLTAGQRARIDAALVIGSQVETVQVEASAAVQLQSDSSDIGATLPTNAIAEMPTNGRNYYDLIGLQAGVKNPGAPGGPTDTRVGMVFSANGQSATFNNNMIDGMDNNEKSFGGLAQAPSLDALQEVQVETSNYSAEYSRTGGGIANLITKSGTNQFHGTAFEFMRNDAFDAYKWTTGTKKKTELRQNQFGGSLGGPIFKNKAFFFGDYQGWRQIKGGLKQNLAANTAEYNSIHDYFEGRATNIIFSDPFDAWGGDMTKGYACVGTGCPASTSTVTVATIPQVNPLGLAYLMEAPAPLAECASQPNGVCGNYNWEGPANTVQNSNTYDGRIDYHINDTNTLFGRLSYSNIQTVSPGPFPATKILAGSDKTYAPLESMNPWVTTNIALDYVHIFDPKTVFEAKASFLRSNMAAYTSGTASWSMTDFGFDCGTDYCYNSPNVVGLPFLWFMQSPSSQAKYPGAAFMTGYGYEGDGGYQGFLENSFQYNTSLTLNRGSHSIKMGVTLIRRQINAPANNNDTLTYSPDNTGNSLADLAGGYLQSISGYKTMVIHYGRLWEPGAYIQDDWRATKSLTLNLGVRYDLYTPTTDREGNISNFNYDTHLIVSPALLGPNKSGPTGNVKTDFGGISPRLGFAYTVPGNNIVTSGTVIRGGFGVSYFPANSGTPGGLQQYELLNAPFQWSGSCGAGPNPCGPENGLVDTTRVNAQNNNAYWLDDYGNSMNGEYNLRYGLPLAKYQMELATDPTRYASSLAGNVFILPNYKPSYLMQYNLQMQKQRGNSIFTVGFVGNLGRRMNTLQNLNQPRSYAEFQAGTYPMYSAATPWMNGVTVASNISGGNSSWTAGEATFERRLTKGLSTSVNYTWARSASQGAGTAASACVLDGCPMDSGDGTPVLIHGWRDWGYDGSTSNRAAGMISYAIPFANNLHGVAGWALKGWELNATGNWNTGAWTKVTSGRNQSGASNYAKLYNNGSAAEYPNRVPGVSVKPANQTPSNWINPAAFTLQAAGLLGNAKSSSIQQPRARDVDLGIGKTFSLLEGFKLQFRAESFNLTNTPNYGAASTRGGGTLSISTYNADGTGSTAGGFGNFNSVGNDPRVMQFGLKLIY
jgi:hypothetical protein